MSRGRTLVDLCISCNLYIVNGRKLGDASTPGGYFHYDLTRGSGLFEGPAKDYQMAQFREIILPLALEGYYSCYYPLGGNSNQMLS